MEIKIEHRLTEVEERSKSNTHRIDDLEQRQNNLDDLVGTERAADGSETTRIVCSIPVTIYFAESEQHEETEGQVVESLSEMEQKVLETAEAAEKNISEAEQKALTTVAGIQEQLDNGDFVGPVGPQGPSGPRGDDYVLTEADKDEIAEMQKDTFSIPYEQRVVNRIREKYSIDDELAILRQRDTKPYEFAEYNDFVEKVKAEERGET